MILSLLLGLDKETCLIPVPPQQLVECAQSYTLLTENLVLTQLTLHLGFHRYLLLVILNKGSASWHISELKPLLSKAVCTVVFLMLFIFHY